MLPYTCSEDDEIVYKIAFCNQMLLIVGFCGILVYEVATN